MPICLSEAGGIPLPYAPAPRGRFAFEGLARGPAKSQATRDYKMELRVGKHHCSGATVPQCVRDSGVPAPKQGEFYLRRDVQGRSADVQTLQT